jgi:membrane protein DedA with SNARE-associated domain
MIIYGCCYCYHLSCVVVWLVVWLVVGLVLGRLVDFINLATHVVIIIIVVVVTVCCCVLHRRRVASKIITARTKING